MYSKESILTLVYLTLYLIFPNFFLKSFKFYVIYVINKTEQQQGNLEKKSIKEKEHNLNYKKLELMPPKDTHIHVIPKQKYLA